MKRCFNKIFFFKDDVVFLSFFSTFQFPGVTVVRFEPSILGLRVENSTTVLPPMTGYYKTAPTIVTYLCMAVPHFICPEAVFLVMCDPSMNEQ
jgi:hypothetical protein